MNLLSTLVARAGHGRDRRSRTAFPRIVLALALVGLLVSGFGAWRLSTAFRAWQSANVQALRIERLAGTIAHLDEVLTMSARLRAVTGDARWEQRYERAEPSLSAALTEARGLERRLLASAELGRIDDANTALVAMETEAFDLADDGRLDAAAALLSSAEYGRAKQRYAAGLTRLTDGLRAQVERVREAQRAATSLVLAAAAVAVALAAVGWVVLARRLRRWEAALTRSDAARDRAGRESERSREHALAALEAERRGARALERSEEFIRQIMSNAPIVLYAVDAQGIFVLSEGAGLDALGLAPGEAVGMSAFELYADTEGASDAIRMALAGETATARIEIGELTFDSNMAPLYDDGTIVGAVGVSTNVTQEATLERELLYRAYHDPLTDLANRAAVYERIATALSSPGDPVTVLLIDLDGFTDVNDTVGHGAGDHVLVEVARRLRTTVRASDMVARLGSDEFCILLAADEQARADELATELGLVVVVEPIVVAGTTLRLTASIGIAASADRTDDARQLMRDADLAMYAAKQAGGNCSRHFEPALREHAVARVGMRTDLERAIADEQFTVVYQPTVDLRDDRIVGVEALVRWRHPVHGMISPDDFVPLAEETGLIAGVGRLVLTEACTQMRAWQQRHRRRSPPVCHRRRSCSRSPRPP